VPQVRLNVDGVADTDAEVALWDWLRAEPELRGLVVRQQAQPQPGTMGVDQELLVALTSTGTLAAVARTVGVWLIHRHSTVTVTLTLPDGATVALDAHRVQADDVERLLKAARAGTTTSPGHGES